MHGTEKADLLKDRNNLEDKITAMEKVRDNMESDLKNKNELIEELQTAKSAYVLDLQGMRRMFRSIILPNLSQERNEGI